MELNLHTAGSGLFETHISWEDIEHRIQDERKLKVSFGPRRNAHQIGDGNGFMSRIGVIDADFQGEVDGLPPKFVVKMVCVLAGMEIAESVKDRHSDENADIQEIFDGFDVNVRNLHNREVNVYRVFSRFDNSISKMPQVYFAQGFEKENVLKGFIGMEWVENLELRHIFHNVTPEELSDALRALAYLEAKSLQLTDEEKQKVASNPVPIIYPPMMHPSAVSKMFRDMYTASEELRPSGEVLEKITEELPLLELTSTMNEELGMKDVFIHGDLWSANLMWSKTENGVRLSRIIDYQLAHFGCVAEDLARLFISTMSGKDRRENWERLLEEFHGYINQYCDVELPFTLEQLKESYRRMFPLAGTLLLPVFDSVAKIGSRKLSDEGKMTMKTVLSEKTVALFEDILFFAKRNREVRKHVKN
ncbi:hypothetical protein ANCCAN_08800 [Ancylostoma caninum]|uniref:CHK kinase-like domain-containing protein n=1 Tax=Ancylostoma caninum TaxID=29170 RepID=A0A368GLC4_ANCCA|nr:hypothetical protein ANCCAN_08800 [Ancylostoma caninum]